ncbi:hypothetical protein AB1Y20_002091 [Prymnesium parvum]|uniref:Uncharacterized protein n=1 Tax=Prymnesium parvum TaxID=97485 RepID=A0AB34J7I4_PRYPA
MDEADAPSSALPPIAVPSEKPALDPAAAEARRKLRASHRLRNVALQFWLTMGLGLEDTMSKKDYRFIHRRITKALAPELDDREAAEVADSDWAGDLAEAGAEMTFDTYANGLFEIADFWTDSVDELDYVIFLNKLYRRITHVTSSPDKSPKRGKSTPGRKVVARAHTTPPRPHHKRRASSVRPPPFPSFLPQSLPPSPKQKWEKAAGRVSRASAAGEAASSVATVAAQAAEIDEEAAVAAIMASPPRQPVRAKRSSTDSPQRGVAAECPLARRGLSARTSAAGALDEASDALLRTLGVRTRKGAADEGPSRAFLPLESISGDEFEGGGRGQGGDSDDDVLAWGAAIAARVCGASHGPSTAPAAVRRPGDEQQLTVEVPSRQAGDDVQAVAPTLTDNGALRLDARCTSRPLEEATPISQAERTLASPDVRHRGAAVSMLSEAPSASILGQASAACKFGEAPSSCKPAEAPSSCKPGEAPFSCKPGEAPSASTLDEEHASILQDSPNIRRVLGLELPLAAARPALPRRSSASAFSGHIRASFFDADGVRLPEGDRSVHMPGRRRTRARSGTLSDEEDMGGGDAPTGRRGRTSTWSVGDEMRVGGEEVKRARRRGASRFKWESHSASELLLGSSLDALLRSEGGSFKEGEQEKDSRSKLRRESKHCTPGFDEASHLPRPAIQQLSEGHPSFHVQHSMQEVRTRHIPKWTVGDRPCTSPAQVRQDGPGCLPKKPAFRALLSRESAEIVRPKEREDETVLFSFLSASLSRRSRPASVKAELFQGSPRAMVELHLREAPCVPLPDQGANSSKFGLEGVQFGQPLHPDSAASRAPLKIPALTARARLQRGPTAAGLHLNGDDWTPQRPFLQKAATPGRPPSCTSAASCARVSSLIRMAQPYEAATETRRHSEGSTTARQRHTSNEISPVRLHAPTITGQSLRGEISNGATSTVRHFVHDKKWSSSVIARGSWVAPFAGGWGLRQGKLSLVLSSCKHYEEARLTWRDIALS